MSEKNVMENGSLARRRLLKQLTAAGGTAVSLTALPATWVRPIAQSVLVPVHAELTSLAYFGSNLMDESPSASTDEPLRWFEKLAAFIVPASHAIPVEIAGSACATPKGNLTTVIWQNKKNSRRYTGDLPTSGGISTISETQHSVSCSDSPCSPLCARIVKMDENGVQVEIQRCEGGTYLFTIPPNPTCSFPALDGDCATE